MAAQEAIHAAASQTAAGQGGSCRNRLARREIVPESDIFSIVRPGEKCQFSAGAEANRIVAKRTLTSLKYAPWRPQRPNIAT